MLVLLVLVGCNEGSGRSDGCVPGESRCDARILLTCQGGEWFSSVDCGEQGKTCAYVAGEPQCVLWPSPDTYPEAHAEPDAEAEATPESDPDLEHEAERPDEDEPGYDADARDVDAQPAVVIIVDNLDAEVSGPWTESRGGAYGEFIGTNFLSVQKSIGRTDGVTFRPDLPAAGVWEVFHHNQTRSLCADNVKVVIAHADGTTETEINQKLASNRGWGGLGSYTFDAGTAGFVTISNDGVTGDGLFVHADAVKFVSAGDEPPPRP